MIRHLRKKSSVITYEYPFNERVRTYLRLEQLFDRVFSLIEDTEVIEHHFALTTMFEIMDVGARADLKFDVMKDLARCSGRLFTPARARFARWMLLASRCARCGGGIQKRARPSSNRPASSDWLCCRADNSIPSILMNSLVPQPMAALDCGI